MKSPAELRVVMRRHWENATRRETRLLGASGVWPVSVSIGKPSSSMLRRDLDGVKRHVETWRRVTIGEVVWEQVRYRQAAEPVSVPVYWKLSRPTEWIEAIGENAVRHEFQLMASLVEQTPSLFHSLLVRKRALWMGKPVTEVIQAARLAVALSPNCAQGRPLRTLTIEGIDTKFFERHATLVTALLDMRFEGEASRIGLENFLGASRDFDHWLLLVDLDGGLLPFHKIRVRCSELRAASLPGQRLLIVENESCQHQLPQVPGTVAVLGAGFDLNWTEASWLSARRVGYWGDIDTWGLHFLAKARNAIPHLDALLMNEEVYRRFAHSTVPEPVVAGTKLPPGLNAAEAQLYRRLLQEPRGRLEQEFLPFEEVQQCIRHWAASSAASPFVV